MGRGISKHRCSDAGDNTRFNFAFVDTGADILARRADDDRVYADAQSDAALAIANGNPSTGSGQANTGTGLQGDWLAGGAGDGNSLDSSDLQRAKRYASVALTNSGVRHGAAANDIEYDNQQWGKAA